MSCRCVWGVGRKRLEERDEVYVNDYGVQLLVLLCCFLNSGVDLLLYPKTAWFAVVLLRMFFLCAFVLATIRTQF